MMSSQQEEEERYLPSCEWDQDRAAWRQEAVQTSPFGVKNAVPVEDIPRALLSTPLYDVGETVLFLQGDGIAFSREMHTHTGTITRIRLLGRRYWTMTENTFGEEQGLSASSYAHNYYTVDRILYILENDEGTPWVDGNRIVGRVGEPEEEEDVPTWDIFEEDVDSVEERALAF